MVHIPAGLFGDAAAARRLTMGGDDFVACRLAEGHAAVALYDLSLRGDAGASVPTALALAAALGTARDINPAGNPSCDSLAGYIAATPFNIRSLDLRRHPGFSPLRVQATAATVQALGRAFAAAPRHGFLQRLCLEADKSVGEPAVQRLLQGLQGCRKLRHLDVADSETGPYLMWTALVAGGDAVPRTVRLRYSKFTALHCAAVQGREQAVQRLLAGGAAVDAETGPAITALHLAARQGHAAVARVLLAAGCNAEAVDARLGWAPLMIAVHAGHDDAARALLAHGCRRDCRSNDNGWCPVRCALPRGHYDVARTLLAAGCPVDGRDGVGRTPLYHAAMDGEDEAVAVLLAGGADPTASRSDNGHSALGMAAYAGRTGCVRRLLARLAALGDTTHVEQRNGYGETPLWRAVDASHDGCVAALLAAGASPDGSKRGVSCLEQAHAKPGGAVFKLLVAAGADGAGMLLSAARKGDAGMLTRVLDALRSRHTRADLAVKLEAVVGGATSRHRGTTALRAAIQGGHGEVAKLLLAAGCSATRCHHVLGGAPLHWAAEYGGEMVAMLREAAAPVAAVAGGDRLDVNVRGAFGTPLHVAASSSCASAVKALLAAGADTTARNHDLLTPADVAMGDGPVFMLRQAAGGDVSGLLRSVDASGATMLLRAARGDDASVVPDLLAAGADYCFAPDGRTALMTAARDGRADVVRLFLDHLRAVGDTAHVNSRDNNNGGTALRYAAVRAARGGSNVACVMLLVAAGADPTIKNNAGEDCFDGASASVKIALHNGGPGARAIADSVDRHDTTPMYRAAADGDAPFLQLLVSAGADPTICCGCGGVSPIGVAAYNGHDACVKLLAAHHAAIGDAASIDKVDRDGDSPLWSAIHRKHPDCVRELLAGGADATLHRGGTPYLARAVEAAVPRTVELLVRGGADASVGTLLADAVGESDDHTAMVAALLDGLRGRADCIARVDAVTGTGDTALHRALEARNDAAMRLLLDAGADPTIGDRHGRSVWQNAHEHLKPMVFNRITDGRAVSIGDGDHDGDGDQSPLMYAVDCDDAAGAAVLVAVGYDVLARDGAASETVLCAVARSAKTAVLSALLDALRTKHGNAAPGVIDASLAMVGAAEADATAHVALLVAAGASVAAVEHGGATALHAAARDGNTAIIR
jgi:cytohesin